MKLPYHIIMPHGDKWNGDEFADKRGIGNIVMKPWYFGTLRSERPCDGCHKIGSYITPAQATPSYDVSFCLECIGDGYRVSKKNKKCTCKCVGHGDKCYFKKFQNYRKPSRTLSITILKESKWKCWNCEELVPSVNADGMCDGCVEESN